MEDIDYADDLALQAYIQAQDKSLWDSRQQASKILGLNQNRNKTELITLKQEGSISTLSGKSLKLVGQFTHFGSNVTSTESYVNIHIASV